MICDPCFEMGRRSLESFDMVVLKPLIPSLSPVTLLISVFYSSMINNLYRVVANLSYCSALDHVIVSVSTVEILKAVCRAVLKHTWDGCFHSPFGPYSKDM